MFIIGRIEEEGQIDSLSPLAVDYLLWNTKKSAKTLAYIAYIEGKGICIKMVCKEASPIRSYKEHGDPVYLDSAMEAFLMFPSALGSYLNIEVNANGAILAQYGSSRRDRSRLTREEIAGMHCLSRREETQWSFRLLLSDALLCKVFGRQVVESASFIKANFYKINEGLKEPEFAAYAPIPIAEPDFHRPEFFVKGFFEASKSL